MVRVDDGAASLITAPPLDRIDDRVRRHTNSRKGRLRAVLLCFGGKGERVPMTGKMYYDRYMPR